MGPERPQILPPLKSTADLIPQDNLKLHISGEWGLLDVVGPHLTGTCRLGDCLEEPPSWELECCHCGVTNSQAARLVLAAARRGWTWLPFFNAICLLLELQHHLAAAAGIAEM